MKARSLRILPTLSLSVGLLILLGVGLVLSIQWTASQRILSDLGGRLVVRNLEMVAQGIRGHLDPVQAQVEYLAGLIEGGAYDLGDKRGLADLLVGSVAASPQIGAVVVGDMELRAIRIRRAAASGRYEISYPDFGRSAQHRVALTETVSRKSGHWAELFYNPKIDTTFMNYRRPLRRNGEAIGVIAAAVTIKEFSGLAAELSEMFGSTTFVLYGHGKVLAHPRLVTKSYPRSAAEPAISADRIGDAVIAALDTAAPSTLIDVSAYPGARIDKLEVDGIGYFVLRRPLQGYGKVPITIATYRAAAEVNAPIRLLVWSGLAGLVFLLISLVGAIWLSRLIARPIRRVTEGVAKVGELSFAEVEPVPSSWIKEVSDLAASFNDMLGGLKSFEIYVPRTLVQRLIKREGGAEVTSEERELTVM
ncbi:MAG: HAMP domain-containing protein, partial [Alphaproteobacteria bacterium]|nr:HAMP domain-containing protein [Alphaproteobacteria bacterium]